MSNKNNLRKRFPFLAFVCCFFIGTATGYLLQNTTSGILVGLGVGLIIMALARFFLRGRKREEDASAGSGETP